MREARLTSGKEPFDFERFRELYRAIGVAPDFRPLTPEDAEEIEERYYSSWDDVKTLQEAAAFLYWLKERDCT